MPRGKPARWPLSRRRRPSIWALLLVVPGLAAPLDGAHAESDHALCRRAIEAVEPGTGLPPGLLAAIGRVESGRRDPLTGRTEPWPWSLNIAGAGYYAQDRAQAVAVVAQRQAQGIRSIDVGCMQVNLLHHPHAFPDLETAFDPVANVRYAAAFLADLHRRAGGDWSRAIAWYHSATPERGAAYLQRVQAALGGALPGMALAAPRAEHHAGLHALRVGGVAVITPRALLPPGGTAPATRPIAAAPVAARLPRVIIPQAR